MAKTGNYVTDTLLKSRFINILPAGPPGWPTVAHVKEDTKQLVCLSVAPCGRLWPRWGGAAGFDPGKGGAAGGGGVTRCGGGRPTGSCEKGAPEGADKGAIWGSQLLRQ